MAFLSSVRQLLRAHRGFELCVVLFSREHSIKMPRTAHEYHAELRLGNENIETKRSRLLYQSKKRGILENDILLGEFADEMVNKMSLRQLMRYDEIINGEHMEWDLYYYISGRKNLPEDLEGCEVFQLLRDFVESRTKEACEKAKQRK